MPQLNNIFNYIPEEFFKPLASKYKREYVECIGLIFHTFKSEISYGINREIIVARLEEHFGEDTSEMFFEDENIIYKDARNKANAVIRYLKNCGWFEQESLENHEVNLVINEYAIPIIESFDKIVREEETEYQGIITQIYSTLLNGELYSKPYELILKGVKENTDRLLSELKKLSVSIKRHMDKQTNDMQQVDQVLEHLMDYQSNIGSKAYLRMKTSENIYYFRSEIIVKLDYIMGTPEIMEYACTGYMELEGETSKDVALEEIVALITGIKSSFYRLDDIIEEIDKKNAKCIKSAVMRTKFLLASGNNMEGKILAILNDFVDELNEDENASIYEDTTKQLQEIIQLFPQRYLESESLRAIPVTKKLGEISSVNENEVMSAAERALYKEAMREKNRNRFTRQKIDAYVAEILQNQDSIRASSLELKSKRDLIRIIYISIYGNNKANCYRINRTTDRMRVGEYEFPDFEIVKS